jgi:hypothetical protein
MSNLAMLGHFARSVPLLSSYFALADAAVPLL